MGKGIYWAIKGKDGKLVKNFYDIPYLWKRKVGAAIECDEEGERPVRVTITEVE